MSDKQATQAMGDGSHKGEPDGTMPTDKRGAGDGGPIGPKGAGKGKEFRGGQSGAAYHGSGQLGEQDVDSNSDNPNAPSRER